MLVHGQNPLGDQEVNIRVDNRGVYTRRNKRPFTSFNIENRLPNRLPEGFPGATDSAAHRVGTPNSNSTQSTPAVAGQALGRSNSYKPMNQKKNGGPSQTWTADLPIKACPMNVVSVVGMRPANRRNCLSKAEEN